MTESPIPHSILASEQGFFDREAAEIAPDELLIPPREVNRYRLAKASAWNIPKETLFSRILPLDGKRVLDYGCGHGENACLLAACGAQVSAFDLSAGSIRTARQRADAHGLADRIRFDVAAAGKTAYPDRSFEVITGFAILHHLHMALPVIYGEIDRLLTPGGIACFIEPVANSPALRLLRRLTPVSRDATPDERQLVYGEFEMLKEHGFSSIEYAHFYCLERLRRIVGQRCSGWLRWVDHHLQRVLPFTRRYYGTVLVIARR